MYSNAEILTAVIVTWVKPMVDAIVANQLGQFQFITAANEWVKKYFPVANNYSIVNDLSFLAVPATKMAIEPRVRNAIATLGISDADIPAYAAELVNSLIAKAKKDGKVTLFNTVELDQSDFDKLRHLLEKNLPVEVKDQYEVIL